MSNPWDPPRNLQPYIVVPAEDIFFMEDGAPGQSPVLIPNSLCGTECGDFFLDLYEVLKAVENHDPYTACKRKVFEEDRRRKSIPNHSKRRKRLVSTKVIVQVVGSRRQPCLCGASSGARHGRSDKAPCSSSASRGASLLQDAGSWRQRHQWASSGSRVVRTTLRQPEVASSVSSSSASEATSRTSPCRVTTVACRERDN